MTALTLLVGRVLHAVGAVAQVGDQGVGAAARRVADQGFDVVASVLSESASVHGEVGGGLAENTCQQVIIALVNIHDLQTRLSHSVLRRGGFF